MKKQEIKNMVLKGLEEVFEGLKEKENRRFLIMMIFVWVIYFVLFYLIFKYLNILISSGEVK